MTRLLLVRHGEAAAGWGIDADPGLSELGREQSRQMAASLDAGPRLPVRVSPLRRARETAAPLEGAWSTTAAVDPVIRELPSPNGHLHDRAEWLRGALRGRWHELHDEAQRWRDAIVDSARALTAPEVWVTHFVVINTVVGAETGAEQVVVFSPANCSVTEVEVRDGELTVLRRGHEARTEIG